MSPQEQVDLSQLKVMLFLEEKDQLKHYLSILRFCGLRGISVAERLSDAIQYIISEKFDLIFVTHKGDAPGVTNLLEELKGFDATSSIPVVALLAEGSVKNALCVLAKGVDRILIEPLSQQSVESVAREIYRSRLSIDPDMMKLNRARDLVCEGTLDEARKIYLELHHQAPGRLDVCLGLFDLNCQMSKWDEAERNLKEALELAKSSQDRVQVHRNLAEVFLNFGVFYEKRHNLDNAIKSYKTALSLNPFHVESIKGALRLLQKLGDIGEMVELLSGVRDNFLPYSQALEQIVLCVEELAQKFIDMNMPVQARRLYEQLVKIKHQNPAIHLKICDFFLGHGKVSLVLNSLMAASQKVKDPDILAKIGTILLDSEKRYMPGGRVCAPPGIDLRYFEGRDRKKIIGKAQKAFQQALFLDSDNPWIRLNLASCNFRLGEIDSGTEILEKLKELHNGDLDVSVAMVEMLVSERVFDLAGEWLKEMSGAHPKECRFYLLYAEYYKSLERDYDAVGCLKRGMSIEPDRPEFIVELARLYQKLEQYSDAILYFEKASKLLPSDASVQEGLKEVLAAKYQGRR